MESGLLAKTPRKLFEVEGGSYCGWLSVEFPILSEAKLGGGLLTLQPFGLTLPHHVDSPKIAYVTQGTGKVGMLLSGASKEKVLKLKKGDMTAVPLGSTSWWFNDGNTEFTVLFLGDTSKAHNPGNFGAIGTFNGFPTEFLKSALSLSEEDANAIVKSQTATLIVKLKEEQNMPAPSKEGIEHMVYNTEVALSNTNVNDGGRLVVVTSEDLGLLKEVGLSGVVVKLQKNGMYAPEYSPDSAYKMIYIVKGGGRVKVVGLNGQNVLDETVKVGVLFIVPRFFVVSVIAGDEGMEWFSIFTLPKPLFSRLAGRTSVWTALSPEVVQASLNITPKLEEHFRAKMSMNDIIFPGPN